MSDKNYEIRNGDVMSVLMFKDTDGFCGVTIYGSDFLDYERFLGVSVQKLTGKRRLSELNDKDLYRMVEEANKGAGVHNSKPLDLKKVQMLRDLESSLIASGELVIPRGHAECDYCSREVWRAA